MPSHTLGQSSERLSLQVALILAGTIISLLLYMSHFSHELVLAPPSRSFQEPNATCSDLKNAGDVFVLLKTGAGEARKRLPAYINHTLRCIPHYAIYSDLDDVVAGHAIHDALAEIPEHVKTKYPEFETYRALQDVKAKHSLNYSDVAKQPSSAKEDLPGWKLDKWKFLPLLEKAREHNAKWVFFMETDTHLVWSNLLHWVDRLDSEQSLYMAGQAYFGTRLFGHGGAGFLLSRAAVEAATTLIKAEPERYEEIVAADCCGDIIIGTVMKELGVDMLKSWPMLQGETPSTLDYTSRHWCFPVVTQHHMSSEEITAMWDLEQQWLLSGNVQPSQALKHGDVFDHFFKAIPDQYGIRTDWDNLSKDELIFMPPKDLTEEAIDATIRAFECDDFCHKDPNCVQYTYAPGECRIGHTIRIGHALSPQANSTRTTNSGWMLERVEEYRQQQQPCSVRWITDHSDET